MARAAHELNNALNGAGMNLEVVRLRAAPGKDAGAVAPFAAAALAEQEGVAAMTAALLGLGRTPKDGRPADVREALTHAAALVAPVVRHQGVAVEVDADDAAPTGAPPYAARLAVVWALEEAAAVTAGADFRASPDDRSGVLRCKLSVGPEPTLEVSPAPAAWAGDEAETLALLAAHGIRAAVDGVVLRLTFPAP